MSWTIQQRGTTDWVVLDTEMGIQSAAEFYQAILPLAGPGHTVRVDAGATQSVHTSILQILYALSQAVEDFGVAAASTEFQSAEVRLGHCFGRSGEDGVSVNDGGKASDSNGGRGLRT